MGFFNPKILEYVLCVTINFQGLILPTLNKNILRKIIFLQFIIMPSIDTFLCMNGYFASMLNIILLENRKVI